MNPNICEHLKYPNKYDLEEHTCKCQYYKNSDRPFSSKREKNFPEHKW